MVIYEKVIDGIRYEQNVVATEEPERVKELTLQGWSKVEPAKAKEPTPPAKATSEDAHAPKAKE
jgi:hypothetical protein